MEEIGTVSNHAYIIECVLNEHLNKDQPVSYINKHQPKWSLLGPGQRTPDMESSNHFLQSLAIYLTVTVYILFLPQCLTQVRDMYLTRFGFRPGTSFRVSGQPAKGVCIQEIMKVF
jgi:hypothetical protein